MKKILILVILLMSITGCGKKKPSVVCTYSSNINDMNIDTQISLYGDKGILDTYEEQSSIEAFDYSPDEKQEFIDGMNAKYDGYQGISIKASSNEDHVEYELVVDLHKASIDDLKELLIIDPNILVTSTNFSIIASKDSLEAKGYDCREQ